MNSLKWFTDAGHGWLRVPFELLHESGVANQISMYSYIEPQGKVVYLEEDVDAPLFLEAMFTEEDGFNNHFPESHTDGDSFVRKLAHYEYIGEQHDTPRST